MTPWKLAAAALLASAACHANQQCLVDQQCERNEACRLEIKLCAGWDRVGTITGGHCRDFGSVCSSNADCVPSETCRSDGICRYDDTLCKSPPVSCPTGCQLHVPYPCACVCSGPDCP